MKDKCIHTICPICEEEVKAFVVERCGWGYDVLRCPLCHLEFASPLKGPGKRGYEAWYKGEPLEGSGVYVDCASRLNLLSSHRLRDYHIKAMQYLKMLLNSHNKLLDVGCAEGTFIKAMEDLGFDVYGCDIAEEPIKFAKQFYHLKNVLASTPEELPKEWRDFEIITCFEVLEHVENPLCFLQSIFNLLKPGGFLFLSVPHYELLTLKRRRGGAEWDRPPEHLTRWPKETLRIALRKVGFPNSHIKLLKAGEWENFLDAILPIGVETLYWRLWERKARELKLTLLESAAERGIRFCLLPLLPLIKTDMCHTPW